MNVVDEFHYEKKPPSLRLIPASLASAPIEPSCIPSIASPRKTLLSGIWTTLLENICLGNQNEAYI
jgi:hypothetical protein